MPSTPASSAPPPSTPCGSGPRRTTSPDARRGSCWPLPCSSTLRPPWPTSPSGSRWPRHRPSSSGRASGSPTARCRTGPQTSPTGSRGTRCTTATSRRWRRSIRCARRSWRRSARRCAGSATPMCRPWWRPPRASIPTRWPPRCASSWPSRRRSTSPPCAGSWPRSTSSRATPQRSTWITSSAARAGIAGSRHIACCRHSGRR